MQPFYYFTCYNVASQWSVEAPTTRWAHLAYVFDSDNAGRLYVNGALRATYPAGQAANTGPTWVAIGWGANSYGEYWHGRLAHVAVYPAVLSQRHIRNHFSPSTGRKPKAKDTKQANQ